LHEKFTQTFRPPFPQFLLPVKSAKFGLDFWLNPRGE